MATVAAILNSVYLALLSNSCTYHLPHPKPYYLSLAPTTTTTFPIYPLLNISSLSLLSLEVNFFLFVFSTHTATTSSFTSPLPSWHHLYYLHHHHFHYYHDLHLYCLHISSIIFTPTISSTSTSPWTSPLTHSTAPTWGGVTSWKGFLRMTSTR